MTWINKDNTKPLYLLSIERLLAQLYSTDAIRVSKTKDILLFSVNGSTATLVKGSINDKEHLIQRQLLGVELLYESEKPNMFAIVFNKNRIIASDKKVLLDTIREMLKIREKHCIEMMKDTNTSRLFVKIYANEIKNIHEYFKALHKELKYT
jgi:hypothetical protein